jgi:hypothetical protein
MMSLHLSRPRFLGDLPMTIWTRLGLGLLLVASPALTLGKPVPAGAPAKTQATGMYEGVYEYPAEQNQEPVKFKLALVQDGGRVVGFIQETNTFGERKEPWLHSVLKGTLSDQGQFAAVKTYDGTAGPAHDVKYDGQAAADGSISGTWAIGELTAPFKLTKVAATKAGPFSGLWSGEYRYPGDDDGGAPVGFTAIVIHEGDKIVGLMKEKNTFGAPVEPWLAAGIKGTYDADTRHFSFTKTYDGTAGPSHDVEYSGSLNRERGASGAWNIDGLKGTFTLQNLRLDKNVLDTVQ